MADDGTLVNRPDCYGTDTDIILTAVITNGPDTITGKYKITIKQDPTLQPSTDIPIRSIGFEYDQIYPDAAPDVYPEITSVAMSVIDEENGVYQFTIRDDQYVCSQNAEPFFFWSARQGTFLPVEGYDDYRSVRFTIDPDALDKNVKVVVGIGDSLGYVDRKAIIIKPSSGVSVAGTENEAALMSLDDINTSENEQRNISLAIGVDTSADMLNFDPGETKTWMDSVEGLIETVGNSADIALVTKDSFGYTKDAESAENSLSLIKADEYSGRTDALEMLERCSEALNDEENISQTGNKAIVLFVPNIENISEFESKIEEIEANGTAVYIMLLSDETYEAEQIRTCSSVLKLRLNISELYTIFSNTAQVMTANAAANDAVSYTSDFKIGRHNLNVTSSNTFGAAFSSILNLYGCLPVYTDDYNIFNENINDVYNIAKGNAAGVTSGSANKIAAFYNSMSGLYDTDSDYFAEKIINNLRYRFPVIVESDGTDYIITEASNDYFKGYVPNDYGNQVTLSVSQISKVFDTYNYLLQVANSEQIVDDYMGESSFYDRISFNIPEAETNEPIVKVQGYGGTTINENQININGGVCTITGLTTDNQILAGIKTEYNNMLPNIYNSTKYYLVKQYTDETNKKEWYYEYLFKATNLGIVNGDENLRFNAESEVTISEFLKMLIESAGISSQELKEAADRQSGNITEEISNHWAKEYICYALDKNLISLGNVSGANSPETAVPRCDVAYMINRLYIDNINQPNLMIPSNLYKFDDNVSSDRNTRWKMGIAFADQNDIAYCKDEIKQMYLNGAMDGDTDGYVRWADPIKRSEAAKMVIKCRFALDEGINTVRIVNEGAANYIDFSLQDTHTITGEKDVNGSGEFYFVAPKTGYYYINDISGCQVTVSDMKKRDIKGLDGSSGDARYNILKGETAYVKVMTTDSSYSFTISAPDDEALVFAPDRSGTFINDNCPEYIIQEDLADSQYGNTALITAENISGDVTVASSHLVRSQSATIQDHANTCNCSDGDNLFFDYLITNNSGAPITVTINNIGIQTPAYSGYNEDGTYQEAVSYQAWADYKNVNLNNSDKFVGNGYIVWSDGPYLYQNYNAWTGQWDECIGLVNKTITINGNDSEWLFGELAPQIDLSTIGFPIFIIFDCTISGNATIRTTAFHNRDNISINNLSPGKIYTENSYRDYTNEVNGGEKHEIGEKYKGVSNSLAQVYSEGEWVISNNENTKFYSPKIYNRSQFNGVQPPAVSNTNNDEYIFRVNNGTNGFNELTIPTFKYWMTHLNSESERNYSNVIMGSDMLGLKFDGIKVGEQEGENQYGTYYFDNYHTDTNSGNQEVGNGIDDPAAIKMANFSVTENYSIRIKNTSSQSKKVYYMVGNGSGMYYEYSIKGNDSSGNAIDINNSNIRCVLPWSETDANGKARCVFYEMFSFEIGAGEERQLEFEIVIPNIGTMGVYNILYAE